MVKCKYCKEKIKTASYRNNPIEKGTIYIMIRRFVNVKWTTEYYHEKCFYEIMSDSCPNKDICEESAIEDYEPQFNEGYT